MPEDENLFAVPAMSWDDLQIVIDTLSVLGIDTARNCAVGDMFIGAVEPCEGIEIRAVEGDNAFPVEWIGVAAQARGAAPDRERP